MGLTRRALVRLLIGKAVIELTMVIAVAVAFYFSTTNSNLRGALDRADAEMISGWAVDEKNPSGPLQVQLFIDDKFVEQRLASDRAELPQATNTNANRNFNFKTPALAAGEHQARVYALHRAASRTSRALQLIGTPLRFRVDAVAAR